METYYYDELLTQTDAAWLLRFDNEQIWLPKSQCDIDERTKEIDIPEWLAIEKGLE